MIGAFEPEPEKSIEARALDATLESPSLRGLCVRIFCRKSNKARLSPVEAACMSDVTVSGEAGRLG